MKQFEICNHPIKKSFLNEGETISGYWIDATQASKFLNKSKNSIIQANLNDTLPFDLIVEKDGNVVYFFISIEENPINHIEAQLFALKENITEEDLILNEKEKYQIQGMKTKVKGMWLNAEKLARLLNKGTTYINKCSNNDSLPTQILIEKNGRNFKYFVPTTPPSYTKQDALIFFQKNKILQMEMTLKQVDNLPAWKEISAISRVIASSPGLADALISLSKLGAGDLEKMYDFNKKLMKIFPEK